MAHYLISVEPLVKSEDMADLLWDVVEAKSISDAVSSLDPKPLEGDKIEVWSIRSPEPKRFVLRSVVKIEPL